MLLTSCLKKFLFDVKCNTFSYGCVPMQRYLTLRLSLLLTLQCILGNWVSRSVQKCSFMCCLCHYFTFIEALNFNKMVLILKTSTQVYIQLYINIHFAFASFTKRFRSEMLLCAWPRWLSWLRLLPWLTVSKRAVKTKMMSTASSPVTRLDWLLMELRR